MELQDLIQSAAAMGAQMALEAVGESSGVITQRQAEKKYGSWFIDAVKGGRIYPCKLGKGSVRATKWYSIREILLLRTTDIARCESIIVWK